MCGIELLIHSKTSTAALLKFGSDKLILPPVYNGRNYLFLLGLKLISKMGSGGSPSTFWAVYISFSLQNNEEVSTQFHIPKPYRVSKLRLMWQKKNNMNLNIINGNYYDWLNIQKN